MTVIVIKVYFISLNDLDRVLSKLDINETVHSASIEVIGWSHVDISNVLEEHRQKVVRVLGGTKRFLDDYEVVTIASRNGQVNYFSKIIEWKPK